HGDLGFQHGGERQETEGRLGAVDHLVRRRAGRKGEVVAGAQHVLLLSEPQHAFAFEHEHRLLVGEVEMEREGLFSGLQLEPAHPDALRARRGAQPLPPEPEPLLVHVLLLALYQRGPVHDFFPSCTSGFWPRGTAVMLASATRSAMFWAMRVSACASGSPGTAATTGRPSSLPARMGVWLGTRRGTAPPASPAPPSP